jgi:hypothetical protein
MSDLEQRLRGLFDTPGPIGLDEIKDRRPPRGAGVPHGRLFTAVAVVAVIAVATTLAFTLRSGGSGTTVAVLDPGTGPPVVSSIALDETSVVAGRSVRGHVLLDNRTGRTLNVCPTPLFISADLAGLHSRSFASNDPLTGGCTRTRLRPGGNRFPLSVTTMAMACTQASSQATATDPHCTTTGPQPFAAGHYRVIVYVDGLPRGSRQPTPVPVTILAPAKDSVPSTTIAPSISTYPSSLTTVLTAAGPDGTTMRLATALRPRGTGSDVDACYRVTMSSDGAATEPKKRPWSPMAQCEPKGDLDPTNRPVGDAAGELWRSHTGAAYMIILGRAEGARSVQLDFAHHRSRTARVSDGWYLVGLTYADWSAGYRESAISPDGATIATTVVPRS